MKVSSTTAQRFSESLYRLYAADSRAALQEALVTAEAVLHRGEGTGWLRELLRGHAAQRSAQLRDGPPETPAAIANLTRREQEVLHRIALGETDAAIGTALGISPKTASKHVENILRKLGVETRTAAAAAMHPARPMNPAPAHVPEPRQS